PAAPAAATTRQPEARPTQVNGVVVAVDAVERRVTVAHNGGQTVYRVADDAKISADCEGCALARIPAGAQIHLTEFTDAITARHVQANGSAVFARVKAVDVAAGTITILGSQDDGRTFTVNSATTIFVDHKPGSLSAIPPGAQLHALNLRVDQQ